MPGKRSNPKTIAACKNAHMKVVKSKSQKTYCRKSHNKVAKKSNRKSRK